MFVAISAGGIGLGVPLALGTVQPEGFESKQCPAVRNRSSEISVPEHQRTPDTLPGLVNIVLRLSFQWMLPTGRCCTLTKSVVTSSVPSYCSTACESSAAPHCDS